jgi:hypothetical protein
VTRHLRREIDYANPAVVEHAFHGCVASATSADFGEDRCWHANQRPEFTCHRQDRTRALRGHRSDSRVSKRAQRFCVED